MSFFYRICFVYFFSLSCTFGQNLFNDIKYQAETGVFVSTSGKTPFLLRSNQYGIVPSENPGATFRGSLVKEYDSTYRAESNRLNKIAFGYGINAVANAGKVNQILLPEAYLKVRFGVFELYGGRRREIIGLVDTVLTSGSFIWSGNALPIPKIQISIPNYTSILGKGLLSIKGAYAHGWFDNGRVKNFYLHQKYLYARVGKPNWKVKVHSGFNHQVQWGGRPAQPYVDKDTGYLISKFPSDLEAYMNVVSGISINKGDEGINTDIPLNEAWNRVGNHLGTVDLALEFNFKKADLHIYRQSIYEDGSLFYLNNITDGLLGVSLKRKFVSTGITRVSFEYLNTMNQGGETDSQNTIPQLRGRDNYFNNSIYSDGWTYKGNVIGSPLITSVHSVDTKIFANRNISSISPNYLLNRVEALSMAVEGKGKNLSYHTKLMIYKNIGAYSLPINEKQFSFIYRAKYALPKYTLLATLAFDEGGLFTTSLGGYLGIQRTFF